MSTHNLQMCQYLSLAIKKYGNMIMANFLEKYELWQYTLWLTFAKSKIMAICTMANFLKIIAIMVSQIMA